MCVGKGSVGPALSVVWGMLTPCWELADWCPEQKWPHSPPRSPCPPQVTLSPSSGLDPEQSPGSHPLPKQGKGQRSHPAQPWPRTMLRSLGDTGAMPPALCHQAPRARNPRGRTRRARLCRGTELLCILRRGRAGVSLPQRLGELPGQQERAMGLPAVPRMNPRRGQQSPHVPCARRAPWVRPGLGHAGGKLFLRNCPMVKVVSQAWPGKECKSSEVPCNYRQASYSLEPGPPQPQAWERAGADAADLSLQLLSPPAPGTQ